MIALVAGVVLLLLAGFMQTMILTTRDPSEGTDGSIWFSWLGASVLSLGVVYAGIMARRASNGARAAIMIAGLISSLAGLFAGF